MKLEGIEISNEDKVIFPERKLTKGDMVQYYHQVADKMLPYLKDRPLTLQRFPDGVEGDGFYQKNASDYFPDFINRVTIATKNGQNEQVICNNVKTLIYLANQGTVSFHIWLSRQDMLQKPDKVVFDLDPSEGKFEEVKEAAKVVKKFLEDKSEEPKLLATGKSGLHVYYSKQRYHTFDEVREKARAYADALAEKHPNLLTTKTRIDDREGKIFVDYLRNAYGQTVICPYSLRPTAQASIARPIDWKELDDLKDPGYFKLET